MTIVATEDNRNIEWRKNNVGASLLQKMGWKEGQGIGKRGTANTNALRALKRQDGLGLGAKMANEGGHSESANHFSAVLANLQVHHNTSSDSNEEDDDDEPEKTTATSNTKKKKKKDKASKKKKKSSKSSGSLILPQNKVVAGHAQKRRDAKFGKKSAHDLACIFGNPTAGAELLPVQADQSEVTKKRRSSDKDDAEKREKKRRKKERSAKKDKEMSS